MDMVSIIAFCAFLVERLVGYIMTVGPNIPQRFPFAPVLVSLFLGVGIAVGFQLDLFGAFDMTAVHPLVAFVLTGLLIGGGSNLLHDILQRTGVKK